MAQGPGRAVASHPWKAAAAAAVVVVCCTVLLAGSAPGLGRAGARYAVPSPAAAASQLRPAARSTRAVVGPAGIAASTPSATVRARAGASWLGAPLKVAHAPRVAARPSAAAAGGLLLCGAAALLWRAAAAGLRRAAAPPGPRWAVLQHFGEAEERPGPVERWPARDDAPKFNQFDTWQARNRGLYGPGDQWQDPGDGNSAGPGGRWPAGSDDSHDGHAGQGSDGWRWDERWDEGPADSDSSEAEAGWQAERLEGGAEDADDHVWDDSDDEDGGPRDDENPKPPQWAWTQPNPTKQTKVQMKQRAVSAAKRAALQHQKDVQMWRMQGKQFLIFWDLETLGPKSKRAIWPMVEDLWHFVAQIGRHETLSRLQAVGSPETIARITQLPLRSTIKPLQTIKPVFMCNYCDSPEQWTIERKFRRHYRIHIKEMATRYRKQEYGSLARWKALDLLQTYRMHTVVSPQEGDPPLPTVKFMRKRLVQNRLKKHIQEVGFTANVEGTVAENFPQQIRQLNRLLNSPRPQTLCIVSNDNRLCLPLALAKKKGWSIVAVTDSEKIAKLAEMAVSLAFRAPIRVPPPPPPPPPPQAPHSEPEFQQYAQLDPNHPEAADFDTFEPPEILTLPNAAARGLGG